jgi:hypothetical protein
MVGMTKESLQTAHLMDVTRREVQRYAGYSPLAKLYPILDDGNETYAVIIIEDDPAARPAYALVMARVVGDKIVIEEDRSFDKPLYEALMANASIPREQIILAYAGESLPSES